MNTRFIFYKFLFFLVLTAAFSYYMAQQILPLTYTDIIDFELVKFGNDAQTLMNKWGGYKLYKYNTHLYLDCGFLLLYSAAIFYGCLWFSQITHFTFLKKLGQAVAITAPFIATFDLMENAAQWGTINLQISDLLSAYTTFFATIKFAFIALAILYVLLIIVEQILYFFYTLTQRKVVIT